MRVPSRTGAIAVSALSSRASGSRPATGWDTARLKPAARRGEKPAGSLPPSVEQQDRPDHSSGLKMTFNLLVPNAPRSAGATAITMNWPSAAPKAVAAALPRRAETVCDAPDGLSRYRRTPSASIGSGASASRSLPPTSIYDRKSAVAMSMKTHCRSGRASRHGENDELTRKSLRHAAATGRRSFFGIGMHQAMKTTEFSKGNVTGPPSAGGEQPAWVEKRLEREEPS